MNLWASWNWAASELFIRLDAETWEVCRQNLVRTLGRIPQDLLESAAEDDSFTANLDRVWLALRVYLDSKTWFSEKQSDNADASIAYFSMEFGLDVGLPIYSGGLGILAGDHLKSVSDLGIPLTGVGLLYQKGYFQQYLNSDGWQMEKYSANDWYSMPVTLQRDENGNPITISVELINETVRAQIWKVTVGRTCLYLLDTNINENALHLRGITSQLYGGDKDNRMRQEILLGVGGFRALEAVGIKPTVYHMNEGHSAFLSLERARQLMANNGMNFAEAREIVWSSTVFTTHTPVPAGNESFPGDMMKRYFSKFVDQLGLKWEEFYNLGKETDKSSDFSLTVLALKMAAHCNGVSKLHGDVSRDMWKNIWPGMIKSDVPIGHVTNGIHTRTWLSNDLDNLLTRYIGPQFIEEPHKHELWNRVDRIPDLELWRTHQIRKERLIFFARKRLTEQLKRRGAGVSEVREAEEVLNSEALTIGFARRFATYKRALLIFSDLDRLKRIIANSERPVQFIFAGKAHPQDNQGKELIRKIIHYTADPAIRQHIVFIEDYDMNVARYMVQGVDVWLSTPRVPLEASGTSGMKAIANGALNVSTLDGWWAESYDPTLGWAIGSGETNGNPDELDRIEAEALYNLLEKEIIPTYFNLDRTDVPRDWIRMMKDSMKTLGSFFNTHRMVMEYCENFYMPAHNAGKKMGIENGSKAREIAQWHGWIDEKWNGVTIRSEYAEGDVNVESGDLLPIRALVGLNGLNPSDVVVEVIYGSLNVTDAITAGKRIELAFEHDQNGDAVYSGNINCKHGGRKGFAVRVRANHPDLVHSYTPLRLKWE